MRGCTLYNLGHESKVHCFAIAGAVFAFYKDQEQKDRMKDFFVISTY